MEDLFNVENSWNIVRAWHHRSRLSFSTVAEIPWPALNLPKLYFHQESKKAIEPYRFAQEILITKSELEEKNGEMQKSSIPDNLIFAFKNFPKLRFGGTCPIPQVSRSYSGLQ